jgi:hypothetical protein
MQLLQPDVSCSKCVCQQRMQQGINNTKFELQMVFDSAQEWNYVDEPASSITSC